ncbi:MAG: endonuclease/exonuclease/phosphatase family protein [Gammaproteobacteria bacterium]|nr:endonuclease/exonuclease/phosphatase family protein [Gammaproteobacteria bacterium]
MTKNFLKFLVLIPTMVLVAAAILWFRAYKPSAIEAAEVECSADAPVWSAARPLKVLSYNIQYMASKNYIFFYDIDLQNQERVDAVTAANKTIASRPSRDHVVWTLDKVADIIVQEDPDVVMIQEINGADDSRTHYIDQVSELLGRLPEHHYPCVTEAPYWQAAFIVHPDILGPVNMKLLTLSKYGIEKSVRHQLPRVTSNFIERPFYFQRALLETHLKTRGTPKVALINTHFEAWGAGTGIMQKQVDMAVKLMQSLDEQGIAWIFGGDLNLLPPDGNRQRDRVLAAGTGEFDETPAIKPLYERYRGIPALTDLTGKDPESWYTHWPNDPTVFAPDRTIDYLFYSGQWQARNAYIRHQDTWDVSDHLPVVGEFAHVAGGQQGHSAD